MLVKSKMKWVALGGLVLSFVSLLVHLLLAKYSSADLVRCSAITGFTEDLNVNIKGRQPIFPSRLAEYQRLRCQVAFHALHFRPGILALGYLMVERLRALGQPYLAFNPGLVRDTLAYHGCAELFLIKLDY